jgi:alpha-galactosidase
MGRPKRFVALAVLVAAAVTAAGLAIQASEGSEMQRAAEFSVPPLASRPPMGWDSWYADRCAVTQNEILAAGRALVSSGLAARGYDYVVLDDCWMARNRAADGSLIWNRATFPRGIPWLARQIHGMGLKFGLYGSIGVRTCTQHPGSWGHYAQDARSFASWGADFVKMDLCQVLPPIPGAGDPLTQEKLFNQFSAALAAVKTPRHFIIYSQELPRLGDPQHESPHFLPFVADSARTANMWRITPDEEPRQDPRHVLATALSTDLSLWKYASPVGVFGGGWNDLDYLLTGNRAFGWTRAQTQAQESIWAEESSPFMFGAALPWRPATVADLGNRVVIGIDQDVHQGHLVAQFGAVRVVSKPYAGGRAVLVYNAGSRMSPWVSVTLRALGFGSRGSVRRTDAWSRVTVTVRSLRLRVPADGAALYVMR